MCGHVCVSAGALRGQMLRMPTVVMGICELLRVSSGSSMGPLHPQSALDC